MKRSIFPFLIFCVLVICSTLYAQEMKGKFAFSGVGGFGFPVSDFAKTDTAWFRVQMEDSILVYDYGFAERSSGLGVNLEYFLTNSLALGLTYFYNNLSFDVTKLEEEFLKDMQRDLPGAEGRMDVKVKGKILTLGVYGKYLFSLTSRTFPYLKIGMGVGEFERTMDWSWYVEYLDERIDFEGFEEPAFLRDFYLDIGTGVLFQLHQSIGLSVEGLFYHHFTKKSEFDIEITTTMDGVSGRRTKKGRLDFNVDHLDLFANLNFFF